jgi:hypothetical protein
MKATLRFKIAGLAAIACTLGALVTFFVPDWIEVVFGADPDRGSGETEWEIVAAFGAVALIAWAFAGLEWRNIRAQASAR